MIARRHPVVAAEVIRSMELGPTIPSLLSLGDAARTTLDMVMRCPVGQHWCTVFAHLLGTLKTTSRALREVDGSTKQRSA